MTELNSVSELNAVSRFTPITLDELIAEAELLTRVDRKYLVTREQAEQALGMLDDATRVLEISGCRSSAYESVYFDTPNFDSYRLAAHGRRRRVKIRTRHYVETGLSFLEVKTRGGHDTTVKERVALALHPNADRLEGEALEYAQATCAEAHVALDLTATRAVLTTRYRRSTLLVSDGSRATIDTELCWSTPDGRTLELPECVVVETKSALTPSALDHALWPLGVRPTGISKFATGLAALHPELPSNKWHRVLERHFANATYTKELL